MKQELFADQVAWVRHLPDEGGEWGKGVTALVRASEATVQRLNGEVDELDAERAKVKQEIGRQTKLLKATIKRAQTECTMVFADAQIAAAKAKTAAGGSAA